MNPKKYLSLLLVVFSFISFQVRAGALLSDTCTVHDICATAIELVNVISDGPFDCINGCNEGAAPEAFGNPCNIDDLPTVWYKVLTDGNATVMNIFLTSSTISNPLISLYTPVSDCANLVAVGLTQNNLACISGTNFEAEAVGTDVGANTIYYIAVSGNVEGGQFELCVNTVSEASICVIDRNVEIVSRTGDGPLTGPYEPGETVSICLNVKQYTAALNGCQWFQGIVPVFGNGWDPSSFDANNQPLNATVNGHAMGVPSNGLYGTATWDWFTDVDYHYDNPNVYLGDFNSDGNFEMCNALYDPNCFSPNPVEGGCCGPCWGSPLGSILPPGWFAYGINGTCPTPGPPIRVDWGDGNTCGGGMGPWSFCFELNVRQLPDCDGDFPLTDLSIGFFTFADGEVGSWTGSASVCRLDQPVKLTLPLECFSIVDLGVETLSKVCEGDTFSYEIFHEDVTTWTWDIDPNEALQNAPTEGDNGFIFHHAINEHILNNGSITITFYGESSGGDTVYTKVVKFEVSILHLSVSELITLCEKDTSLLTITPIVIAGNEPLSYLWSPTGISTPSLILTPPFHPGIHTLDVTDAFGCKAQYHVNIQVKACHLIPDKPIDDNNDGPIPQDSIDKGNFANELNWRKAASIFDRNAIKIYPVPSKDVIHVEMNQDLNDSDTWWITDTRGVRIQQFNLQKIHHRKLQIDISSFPDGVYFLTYATNSGATTAKFIKF